MTINKTSVGYSYHLYYWSPFYRSHGIDNLGQENRGIWREKNSLPPTTHWREKNVNICLHFVHNLTREWLIMVDSMTEIKIRLFVEKNGYLALSIIHPLFCRFMVILFRIQCCCCVGISWFRKTWTTDWFAGKFILHTRGKFYNKSEVECRESLGQLSSIYPSMIKHFVSQSPLQCQQPNPMSLDC